MSSNIIAQVNDCFSDKQQWESFCVLIGKKDEIRDSWLLKLKPALNQYLAVKILPECWEFYSVNYDYRWYLKEFGYDSLCIGLWKGDYGNDGESTDFCLWANPEIVNIETVYQLLHEKKYSPILEAFERKDWMFEDKTDGYVVSERGNWVFGNKDDGSLNLDKIAWYANYKTDQFIQQIAAKVFAFIKDEKITQLLHEINEKANIKKQKEIAKNEKKQKR